LPGADTDSELWSYVYHLSELGRTSEAERAYRSYLERHPNHADSLHNLSLLLEEQGHVQEALALSDKAVTLSPDDELIAGENARMRKEAEEAQRTHLQRFWSQLSDNQKRLLYLVIERRLSHWSQIAGQAQLEEQQLQGQWQTLIDRGAIYATDGQVAEVHLSLLPLVRQESFLLILIQDIIKQTSPRKKHPWIPAPEEFTPDATSNLDKAQRTAFHKAAFKRLQSCQDDALLVSVFLLFYRTTWRRVLVEGGMHQELVDVARILTTRMPERTRQEDWIRIARERWPRVDFYKKQILATLTVISDFEDWADLARLSGTDEKFVKGHWTGLVEQGMIIQNEKGYQVNPHILDLVKQERSHSMVAKIVHTSSVLAAKPIFNSQNEYRIYSVLTDLFPNQLVFPNMALQAIFAFDRMKALLDQETFGYYLKASVDFCVTSTTTYFPLVTFEVDSPYHDLEAQVVRDQKKDHIFAQGGVHLIRLRSFGQPTAAAIRHDIREAVRDWGRMRRATPQEGFAINIEQEIDFEAFESMDESETNR
jgi:hypothetical protein